MTTASMAATSSVQPPLPPVAHAIGGSVGSTLSMLLLYPLERVRIEMQAHVLTRSEEGGEDDSVDENHDGDDDNDHKYDERPQEHADDIHSDEPDLDSVDGANENEIDGEESYMDSQSLDPTKNSGTQSLKGIHAFRRRRNRTPSPSSLASGSPRSPSSDFSYEEIQSTQSNMNIQRKANANATPRRKNHHRSKKMASHPKKKSKSNPPSLLATLYHLHIQKSLYKGSTPIAFTLAISNFIFFYTLQASKMIFKQKSASFFTSTLAGIINVLLTNPFWVANLRIVNEADTNPDGSKNPTKGLFQCLQEIYQKEGVGQLWAGTGASLLLVSNPVIQYYFYESVKLDLLKRRMSGGSGVLEPIEAFVVGALAKGLATVITYPLQLAQVLMRLQKTEEVLDVNDDCDDGDASRSQSSAPLHRGGGRLQKNTRRGLGRGRIRGSSSTRVYDNLLDCMVTLYKQGGVRALYAGMDAKLIQSVLTSAFTFLTYEQILQLVAKSYWKLKALEGS